MLSSCIWRNNSVYCSKCQSNLDLLYHYSNVNSFADDGIYAHKNTYAR